MPIICVVTGLIATIVRVTTPASELRHKRLVWGPIPIINNKYWSLAMRNAGFASTTYMRSFFPSINKREDFDLVLAEQYRGMPLRVRELLAFWSSLRRFDVFVISFGGYFLGSWPFWRIENFFLRLAGKKVIVIPYGSDSYVLRRIRSVPTVHGLLMSYPMYARNQEAIARRVAYWCKHADCLLPGAMAPDGFGRWDAVLPSTLAVDTSVWQASTRVSTADGRTGTVFVAHAPNHRGFKGTEFVIEAVRILKSEGLAVELLLIEKMQNDELRRVLREQVDILVEQLVCTGYALTAVEGLATGLPVISNLEDDQYTETFRRWSFLGECPIVSADPESVANRLRALITRPELRHQLGRAGRQYVEKFHSLEASGLFFKAVLEYLYGQREAVINLYHPLTGELSRRSAPVSHPLVNNRILE
jgi:glycosyltransferase involved in cell wall biosynthesis